MSYHGRRSFIKKHLRINLELDLTEEHRHLFNGFVDQHLGGDGVLFLRLISKNTNPVIAGKKKEFLLRIMNDLFCLGELFAIMWKRYAPVETKLEIISSKGNTVDSDTYLNGGNSNSLLVKDD
jgi:hypothetical protein